jgi:hypothetical protein
MVKRAVRAHWCEGEGVKGTLGCAQGTRGGGRQGSALEWHGGGRLSETKTRVGWPEEPQLRGVLMVRFRRSANTHRIDGVSQCVGCGVILRRRAREKDAAVRRGVISRRTRVMRKVARMRKRVTRRCGMRCRKPYQRWGMKITTRPFFVQGLKRRDPLHHHHPKCQCGLRMCLVYLYLFVSCVQLRLLVRRIFNGSLRGLR